MASAASPTPAPDPGLQRRTSCRTSSHAHRRWEKLRGYDEPVAWARRAVLNRSASWHRKRGRERRALTRLAGRAEASAVAADEPHFEDVDLYNGIPLCASLTIESTSVGRCEAVYGEVVDASSVRLTVSRTAVSPIGVLDCEEPHSDCRFVLDTPDGELRSDALRFVGDVDPALPSLEVSSLDWNRIRVQPSGLEVDPTWLVLRDEHPELAAEVPAFQVSVCAPGSSAVTPTPPPGVEAWPIRVTDRTENCDVLGAPFAIDPDDPDAVVEGELRRLVHGFAGTSDCGGPGCYLLVSRSTQNEVVNGALAGSVEAVTAAPLPQYLSLETGPFPTLVVDTPGPHRIGDEIEVTVGGLPDGVELPIAPCSAETVGACGLGLTRYGNGSHRLVLDDSAGTCHPDRCVLAIFAGVKGVPPLATAPLEVADPDAEAPGPTTTIPAAPAPVTQVAVGPGIEVTATATQDPARPGWVSLTVRVIAENGSYPGGSIDFGDELWHPFGIYVELGETDCQEAIDQATSDDPASFQMTPDPHAGPVDETFVLEHTYPPGSTVTIGFHGSVSWCTAQSTEASSTLTLTLA